MKKKIGILMAVVPICAMYGYIIYDIHAKHGFLGVVLAMGFMFVAVVYVGTIMYLTYPR